MAQKRILLADDEDDIKTIVKLYLEASGYEVLTAFDGLDTLSMAETEKPDVIVLDVMMPVLDGFEVARKLKANPLTREIPIIMLSAANQSSAIRKGLQVGARDYVVKPFEPSKLEQVIADALK